MEEKARGSAALTVRRGRGRSTVWFESGGRADRGIGFSAPRRDDTGPRRPRHDGPSRTCVGACVAAQRQPARRNMWSSPSVRRRVGRERSAERPAERDVRRLGASDPVDRGLAEDLLDPQQLVVLRHPVAAARRARLDLARVRGDGEVGDRVVLGLAGPV